MDDLTTSARPRVLVVDDETTIAHAIRMILEEHGCEVQAAHTGEDGIKLLPGNSFDVALLDIVLPGMNGIGVLTQIKRRSPETEVIMMTSHASIETAVQAIRQGAYDYLNKPFEDIEDVWNQVNRALEKRRLTEQNKQLLEKQVRLNARFSDAVMRLSSLIEIGGVMSGFHSAHELFEFFTKLVSEQMGCDRVSLMTLEPGGLRVTAGFGFTPTADVVGARSGSPVPAGVAQSRMPMRCREDDVSADPSLGGEAPMLCVPVQSWRTVLGVLSVSARRSGEPYTDEDLHYLSGLAGQVAIGIERVRHTTSGGADGAIAAGGEAVLGRIADQAEQLARDLGDRAPDAAKSMREWAQSVRTIGSPPGDRRDAVPERRAA